jgi:DNA-binding response OmpR family regulator
MRPRIVLVDDDLIFAHLLADVLHDAGYQVSIVDDGAHAHTLVPRLHPVLILIDLRQPAMRSRTLLARLGGADRAGCPIIILSANP